MFGLSTHFEHSFCAEDDVLFVFESTLCLGIFVWIWDFVIWALADLDLDYRALWTHELVGLMPI